MAIQNIVSSDKLQSGFRAKYNNSVNEIWVSGVDLGNGTVRLTKHDGTTYDIALTTSFYTKAEVEIVLNDFLNDITILLGALSPTYLTEADTGYVTLTGGGSISITDFDTAYPGRSANGIIRADIDVLIDGNWITVDVPPVVTKDIDGNILTATWNLGQDGYTITKLIFRMY